MLYREKISVRCEIHIEHTNKLCGQNIEIFNINFGCI
jgi:hypothetical protein